MDRSERAERLFQIPVLVAALLVIPVIAIEQSSAAEPWATIAAIANWLIWGVFLAELLIMLALVPDRWAWLRSHPLDLAIVVLTPPFLPASLQALRVFRLLRVLRLLVLVRYARRLFTLEGVQFAGAVAVVTVLGGGAAFAAAEGTSVSTWDGVWWALTTMTTVGYGDLSPQTNLGRVVAILVMLVGIGTLTLVIGAVSQRFIAGQVEEEVAVAERAFEADVDAAREELLREFRAIRERLLELEAIVRPLGTRPPPG